MKQEMTILPHNVPLDIADCTSVLEVALKHKINLEHSCGGMGSCTTCRVLVRSDLSHLPSRNDLEKEIAEMRGFSPQERLACQLDPYEGLVVEIP